MKLPPLNALRAFEAAARHQSFLLAAKEMHVSSASVSRFVKLLEEDLGKQLFSRLANGVQLTSIGTEYLFKIQPALQTIAQHSKEIRQSSDKKRLTILSIPAIAEIWLVERLWSFQEQHKDVQINLIVDKDILSQNYISQLNTDEPTVVLNYCDGTKEDTTNYPIPKERLTLVCNPEIAKKLHSPKDIFDYTLLLDIHLNHDWKHMLSLVFADRFTGSDDVYDDIKHIQYERYSMVLHSALAGSGIAIGHTSLLESYLKTGALVEPFNLHIPTPKQFYAVTAQNNTHSTVDDFIRWFTS